MRFLGLMLIQQLGSEKISVSHTMAEITSCICTECFMKTCNNMQQHAGSNLSFRKLEVGGWIGVACPTNSDNNLLLTLFEIA